MKDIWRSWRVVVSWQPLSHAQASQECSEPVQRQPDRQNADGHGDYGHGGDDDDDGGDDDDDDDGGDDDE